MIGKAAALFAAGHTLPEIAEQLGMTADAVHNWRTRHRAVWDAAYQAAATRVVDATRREADRRAQSMKAANHVRKANGAERHLRDHGETLVSDDSGAGEGKRVSELISDLASERGWNAATMRHYRAVLAGVEKWSGRVLYAHEFHRDWLNRYLEEIEASHLSSATVRGRRTHLIALWRAAFEAELCTTPVHKVRRVKLIQKAPEAWSVDEVNRLLSHALKLTGCYGAGRERISRSTFWRLMIRVLWDTGLRRGDAMRLRRGDLGADGVLQLVQGKVGRWHVCRLHASTLAVVRDVRQAASATLFNWHASDELLRRDFHDRVLDDTGLVGNLKKLRKSSASDVELHYPGMGGVHLGHLMAGNIAHNHYLDPRIVAKNRPMPTELTGDVA